MKKAYGMCPQKAPTRNFIEYRLDSTQLHRYAAVVLNPVSGRLSNAGSVYAPVCRNNFSEHRERRKRDLSVLQSRVGGAEKERRVDVESVRRPTDSRERQSA